MKWLLRLQSPELPELEEKQFFTWLKSCAEHQQAYVNAEAYWDGLAGLQSSEVANGIIADVAANDADKRQSWGMWAIAASVVLFAGLFLLQLGIDSSQHTYRSAVGEQRQISLADGSTVILNTESQLRVEKMESSATRVVHLDFGEALFDIKPDSHRPFIVTTERGSVRVLGTRFTVLSEEDTTLITVLEGKVALADRTVDELSQQDYKPQATLVTDQQLSIAQAIKGERPRQVDAKSLATWEGGRQVYNGVPLGVVVKDLSRYFDGDIKLREEALKSKRVVAVIDLQDKASAIATLEAVFNIVAVNHSDQLTVLQSKNNNKL